ncbi:MAG TPA: ribosomal protein S18-alanine N-acetyltransferase [Thermoanaerobaculia bacterium]|nr:ribosomal protein S18-alanine N-acetyltransferase [Thermoanaerobaculia bacterium]
MLAHEPAPLVIRPARAEDLDRIAVLEEAAFEDSWPRELLSYELTHSRTFLLVASRDDEAPLPGYVLFHYVAGEAELLRLAVEPVERRQGLGRLLVERGLERLRQESIQACFLEVRKDNEAAIQLYRGMGFERVGRRRGYYRDGTDALILSLAL